MQPTPDSPLRLPESRAAIRALQSARKREAVRRAKRAPFFAGKLDHVDLDRLDDPQMWAKIPIMDKDMLRSMSDAEFYRDFCLPPADGDPIAEHWRSGGTTGRPLFYPRSYADIRHAMIGFSRIYQCTGCQTGGRAHVSKCPASTPLGSPGDDDGTSFRRCRVRDIRAKRRSSRARFGQLGDATF